MSERDPWLTEKEAARELRVSAYVVRAEREAGKLGYARLRRRVFYPLSKINEYKASLICAATLNSGNTPTADITSHGPTADDRIAFRRAREMVGKLPRSGRLSS